MTIEERIEKLEKAWGLQDALVKELRDAVTVTAQLEARQGRVLKEHGDWLISHDRAMKEHEESMKTLDTRIANLVSGIGESCGTKTRGSEQVALPVMFTSSPENLWPTRSHGEVRSLRD